MICFPNAKINLGLNIVSKRPDGYHTIETIFYPIDLKDALEIVPAQNDKGTFRQTGIPIADDPEDNLVMKAYRALASRYPLPEIDIHLLKKIPFGAGLGGGSADAACMLKLLNDYAGLSLSDNELEELAGAIGADCAFFIRNKPAFAEGIGNIFEPTSLSLSGYVLVLVKPDIHVSTRDAYAMITPSSPVLSLKEIIHMPIHTWKETMKNDFEPSVFRKYPSIGILKKSLYEAGALYASMSGSGSSVFGIFDRKPEINFPGSQTFSMNLY